MRELWRKLRANRNSIDEDLADELRFHLEERASELEAAGVPPTQALRQARLELGTATAIREESRRQWHLGWMEDWYSDTLHAARGFAKQPGFVLAAILSFGLGIGVNLALFGIASHLILQDPSVKDPGSLYTINLGGSNRLPAPAFKTLLQTQVLPALSGFNILNDINWRNDSESASLFGFAVADRYFEVTGTPLAMGRGFLQGERQAIILGHNFWRDRFHSDSAPLGKSLVINGAIHSIVGILPPDHRTLVGFGLTPDVMLPAGDSLSLQLIARLPQNISSSQALQRLKVATPTLDFTHPRSAGSYGDKIQISNLKGLSRLQSALGPSGAFMTSLAFAMFLLLLLIACANVASLLLARTAARTGEFAIRASLGAGATRIVRQLLAETFLLSLGGATAGIALYFVFTRYLSSLPLQIPFPVSLHAETKLTTLLYALALAIVAAFAAGVTPAWRSSKIALAGAIKSTERQVGGTSLRLRRFLLVTQVSISVLLLTLGLLFLRNLAQSGNLKPGFRMDSVWARMTLVPSEFPRNESIALLANSVVKELRAQPSVQTAAFALIVPFNDEARQSATLSADGGSPPTHYQFHFNCIFSSYFTSMGIPLLRGRDIRDSIDDSRSILLSASFAKRIFGTLDPVGRFVHFPGADFEVVGIVGDTSNMAIGEQAPLTLYKSIHTLGSWRTQLDFLIRPRDGTNASLNATRSRLLGLSPSSAVRVTRMGDAMTLAMLPSQAGALIFGALGLLGLILSAVGLHGTVAFAVRQRRSEIGLRMALGATPLQVLAMILRENATTLLWGSLVGLALAIGLAKPLAIILVPGIHPTNPSSIAAILLFIGLVALIAVLSPARRAMSIDPLESLRNS